MEKAIFLAGILSIVFVLLIFIFLLKEGLSLFKIYSPFAFLFGQDWYPISTPPRFGVLPLLLGSLAVTAALDGHAGMDLASGSASDDRVGDGIDPGFYWNGFIDRAG